MAPRRDDCVAKFLSREPPTNAIIRSPVDIVVVVVLFEKVIAVVDVLIGVDASFVVVIIDVIFIDIVVIDFNIEQYVPFLRCGRFDFLGFLSLPLRGSPASVGWFQLRTGYCWHGSSLRHCRFPVRFLALAEDHHTLGRITPEERRV